MANTRASTSKAPATVQEHGDLQIGPSTLNPTVSERLDRQDATLSNLNDLLTKMTKKFEGLKSPTSRPMPQLKPHTAYDSDDEDSAPKDIFETIFSSDEEDLLDAAASKLQATTDLGPPCKQNIADALNALPNIERTKTELQAWEDRFKVPRNATLIRAPITNNEIWSQLDDAAKGLDRRIQQIQKKICTLTSAVTDMTQVLNSAYKLKKMPGDIARSLTDHSLEVIKIAGSAQRDLSLHRRQCAKRCLDRKFHQVCSANVPITENLFGDKVGDLIKEAKAVEQLSKSTYSKDRYHPYDKPRNDFGSGKALNGMGGNTTGRRYTGTKDFDRTLKPDSKQNY